MIKKTTTICLLLIACFSTTVIASDREEAILLAVSEYVVAARSVLAQNQPLINDANRGDKNFTVAVYEGQVREAFLRQSGIDLSRAEEKSTDDLMQTIYAVHQAARKVVADAQPVINEKGKGFKGYNPAAFSRMVASQYDKSQGLSFKLPSLKWRNAANQPDAFETGVLEQFEKGKREPVYQETVVDGKKVARYMTPLAVAKGCLGCHGLPKGEKDVAGYHKEGYAEGEMRGAISVMMPVR